MNLRITRFVSAVLCLCLLMTGCAAAEPEEARSVRDTVAFQGQSYVPRKGLTSLLVMGLDQAEKPMELKGYTNNLQADFFLLLVLDEKSGAAEVLQLNRDTMTEIRRLGIGGGVADKFQGQLALSHTYGSGGSDSSLNAVKAVSTLLGGVHIDHYITLTMDAVGIINDLAGGVTLTLQEDFTFVDPMLAKGEEVTLKGDQALTYVRTRKGVGDQSNLNRMERQRQYMTALYSKILEKDRQEEGFLADALMQVSEHFTSDCTVNQLEKLMTKLEQCQIPPIRVLDGTARLGEEFMEFYVDEDDLRRQIIELFYEPER